MPVAIEQKTITAEPDIQPRLSYQLYADCEALESELEIIPVRIEAAREAATGETDAQKIKETLADIAELSEREKVLKIQRWHKWRDYLIVRLQEMSTELSYVRGEQVAPAQRELELAESEFYEVKARFELAQRGMKTVSNTIHGLEIQIQSIKGELAQHNSEKPII